MKSRQLLTTLTLGLGLTLAAGLFAFIGRAAPGHSPVGAYAPTGEPVLDPPRNSHTAPLTTTVSIAYDEPISATTVTSRTFAVHGMQSGLVTATHGVANAGGRIVVTPTRPFHQGELVYAIATTGTLGLDGTEPLSATQWQFNAGQITPHCADFTGIEAGLMGVYDSSAAWGDYDNDGDLDILLTGMGTGFMGSDDPTSRVYQNDNGSFSDIDAGLTGVGYSSAAWGDYDNDGDLDILLTGSYNVSRIYRNDGRNPSEGWIFTDIEAGLMGIENGSVAWGDYDNDGDLNILLTGSGSDSLVSLVYRNNGPSAGWTFTDIEAGLPGAYNSSAAWGDYDNDGDLDILLTGEEWDDGWKTTSRVYRNDGGNPPGGWVFTDIEANLPGVSYGSVAWGDYDNDGDLDILLSGQMNYDNIVSQIYRNDGDNPPGGWVFTEIDAGLAGVRNSSAAWGDYDSDSDLDILLTGYNGDTQARVSLVYRNDGIAPAGGWTFTDVGAGLAGVRNGSAAWGDYDNDGDLDILLTGSGYNWSRVTRIYRNDDCPSDLEIVKTVTTPAIGDQAPVAAAGELITYTLTFLNAADIGSTTATDVVITDVVPVSVTISSVVSSGASITNTGATPPYVWQVQDLAPGEGGVITITGQISSTLNRGTILVNTAAIASAVTDADITNNTSTARVTVGTYVRAVLLHPPRNSHTAPLTTTVSATYDEPIDAATVTSRTFAVHGMQSGLVTATHGVSDGQIIVTPTQPFHQGELVYAIATTDTLNITGTAPLHSTQWQFNAGRVITRHFGSFTDIDAGLLGVIDSSVAWGDYDNDGDLDVLLTGYIGDDYYASRVYRNDGPSTGWAFTDIDAGIPDIYGGSVAWGDYDNDGDLDILFTGLDVSTIYRNDDGFFTDIDAGLIGVSVSSVAWGDYDNDGDLDILLTGRGGEDDQVARVYRNDDGDFVDIHAGLKEVRYSSVAWGDYDNDGDLDILLTGQTWADLPHSNYDYVSIVYRNDDGHFTDINAGLAGASEGSAVWGDYDNDGDLDILLTDPGIVYRNDDGVFTDINAGLPIFHRSSGAWGDYDNDGDLDILLTGIETYSYEEMSKVYRNDGPSAGWTFTDIEVQLPDVSSSSAWGDYDNDGDLDILLTGYNNDSGGLVSRIYRNNDHAADLAITKSLVPQVAAPGDSITCTVAFANHGTLTATHVVITDTVPVSIMVQSVISSGVIITDTDATPSYVWQVQDLAPGQSGIITITGVLSALLSGDEFTNTAIITTAIADYDLNNNTSSVLLRVRIWRVTATVPAANALNVPLTTTVVAVFDGDLNASTATNTTFAVHGMMSGLVTGTLDYSGPSRALTLTPSCPFHPGEVVHAVATEGLLRDDGEPLFPYQWQFTAGQIYSRCVAGFTDIGAELTDVYGSSVAWGDYDNDGDLDVLLTGSVGWPDKVSLIYRNDGPSPSGGWVFTDIGAGLTGVSYGSAAWGDYDNDGDLDILLTGYSSSGRVSQVYRNDDGNFADIGAGLTGVSNGSVAWGDYDNDGDLDILLTGGDSNQDPVSRIYRNDGGAPSGGWTFTDIGAGLIGVNAGSAAWGDYDNDGDLDILLTGSTGWSSRVSRIYRNDVGSFTGVDAGLVGVEYSSAAWGDYDNDGDLDILLTGYSDGGSVSLVYRNDGSNPSRGRIFTDISAGLTGNNSGTVAWGDYDNDGDLDILLAIWPTRIYRNDGSNSSGEWVFTNIDVELATALASSAAWGDYDNDGDLDILLAGEVEESTPGSFIYRNDDCAPDLALVKTATPRVAASGDSITYTLTFSNAGSAIATGVFITDAIPSSVVTTSVVHSGAAITDTGLIPSYVWQVQDLAPGEGGVITITGPLDASSPTGIVTNTAAIAAASTDANPDNNSSSAQIDVYAWRVTATLPPANAVGVPLTTPVAAVFNSDLDASTASSATFAVHGMQSGLVTGTLAYDGPGRALTLTPGRPFHAGETVRASATGGLLRLNGDPLFPYQWQFTAGRVISRCVAGFTDIGAGLTGVENSSVAWGDYDNDGDLDILLTGTDNSWNPVSKVFRNDTGSFTDIGAALVDVSSGSAAWGDYDNDGDLDILLTGRDNSWNHVSRAYRNDSGSFIDINAELTGVYNSSVAWGDYDNDGDLDILLTGYASDWPYSTSRVYRNDNGSFIDINAGLTGVHNSSAAWGDYDNDGDLDILLTGTDSSWNPVSRVYRNDLLAGSERVFTDIDAGLMGGPDSSVAWGDYDNDGDLDILLTGAGDSWPPVSRIYRNDNGDPSGGWTFTDIGTELTSIGDGSAAWGDYDNDGDLDILLTGEDGSRVYRNDNGDPSGGWAFTDIGAGLPGTFSGSAAWGDYDNDGDLDILLTGSGIAQIYRNDDCAFSDLLIAKAVTPKVAVPGETITYTLAFSNGGTLTATEVVITDIIPSSVVTPSVVHSGAAITDTGFSPSYVWQVQVLAPGESGVITITGVLSDSLPDGHTFTNTAVIATTAVDDDLSNNQASAAITVTEAGKDWYIYLPLVVRGYAP